MWQALGPLKHKNCAEKHRVSPRASAPGCSAGVVSFSKTLGNERFAIHEGEPGCPWSSRSGCTWRLSGRRSPARKSGVEEHFTTPRALSSDGSAAGWCLHMALDKEKATTNRCLQTGGHQIQVASGFGPSNNHSNTKMTWRKHASFHQCSHLMVLPVAHVSKRHVTRIRQATTKKKWWELAHGLFPSRLGLASA